MVSLIIWYNPQTGSYYHRFYNLTFYKLGDRNSFNHIVVQFFVYDDNLGFVQCNDYFDYYNKIGFFKPKLSFKKRLINNLIGWLNKLKG